MGAKGGTKLISPSLFGSGDVDLRGFTPFTLWNL